MRFYTLLSCIVLSATLSAQTTKFFIEYDHRVAVSEVGDTNGDGIPDFAVSIQAPNAGSNIGLLEVRSGATGEILVAIPVDNEFFPSFQNGAIIAPAGDVNGDGFGDIITGHPNDDTFQFDAGSATVYSGHDGSIIYTIFGLDAYSNAGISVAGLGDLNNDGFDDFAIGEPRLSSLTGGGLVRVFSGIDGTTMLNLQGSGNDHLGFSVANATDLNNDGVNDFIVGQPHYTFPSMTQRRGRARVFSGSDGALLFDINGDSDLGETGYAVGSAGDINNDGIIDLAIGEPGRLNPMTGLSGRIRIVSGNDGSDLHTIDATLAQGRLGRQLVGIADLSGDGVADLAAPEGIGTEAQVHLFSGVDGSPFKTFPRGPAGNFMLVRDMGDMNNDGIPDLATVSNPTFLLGPSQNISGSKTQVRIYESGDTPVSAYSSTSGNLPLLGLSWTPESGNIHDTEGALHCSGATPGALGTLVASLAPGDIPIFGTDLLVAVDPINLLLLATLGADGTGSFAVSGITRRNPAIAGTRLYVQMYETSPAIRASNGLRFVVIP